MTKIHSAEQVFDVAARMFAERGYEATKLEDIAQELGVLQGSLYYHIKSKASLYRSVRQRRFTSITEKIEEISQWEATAYDRLESATLAHLRYIEAYLPETDGWFVLPRDPKRTPEQSEVDRSMTRRYRNAWKAILESGIALGEIDPDIDLSVTVLSYHGMLNWVSRWYTPDGPRSIDELAHQQLALFWGGIAE